MKAKLRTLLDPEKYICGPFQPELFCDVAKDGSPFRSQHLVYVGGEYIGVIFRFVPGEGWRYGLRGVLGANKKYFEQYTEAIRALYEAYCKDQAEWRAWIEACKGDESMQEKLAEEWRKEAA